VYGFKKVYHLKWRHVNPGKKIFFPSVSSNFSVNLTIQQRTPGALLDSYHEEHEVHEDKTQKTIFLLFSRGYPFVLFVNFVVE